MAVDFAATCPLQSAYLHEAANTSLYDCNRYAEDIKLANFHDRVQLVCRFQACYVPYKQKYSIICVSPVCALVMEL